MVPGSPGTTRVTAWPCFPGPYSGLEKGAVEKRRFSNTQGRKGLDFLPREKGTFDYRTTDWSLLG